MNAHFRIGRKYTFNNSPTPFARGNTPLEYIGFHKKFKYYEFKYSNGYRQIISRGNALFSAMIANKTEVK